MLKWAVTNKRRSSDCSTAATDLSSAETCSNLSSDSSEGSFDLSVPIRYHERRASRPRSLALNTNDVDFDRLETRRPAVQRMTSSPLYGSCSRGSRHSLVFPTRDSVDGPTSYTTDSINIKSPSYHRMAARHSVPNTPAHFHGETTTGDILRISTTAESEKPKSRNSFWRNLRMKAQGKKEKKLMKAQSMSNLPDNQTATDACHDRMPVTVPTYDRLSATAAPTLPGNDISPSYKGHLDVMRRRSFKLIKKQNENKKPKLFSKMSDAHDGYISSSPDSGISGVRLRSLDSDSQASPVSPVTPIDLDSTDLSCLRQQFTDAVFQYLNERLEKKGYTTISVPSSTRSSRSDDGAMDIFCYDTDTVLRRPGHTAVKAHF